MLITWNEKIIEAYCKKHPNTDGYYNTLWQWTLTETSFTDWNWLYIGILDNPTIPTNDFQIVEKTEAEVNTLLNTWYPWLVTVSNWIFSDNRSLDI